MSLFDFSEILVGFGHVDGVDSNSIRAGDSVTEKTTTTGLEMLR